MCLAIPSQIKEIYDEQTALISLHNIEKKISIALTPDVKVGDYVVVHVGYALSIIDQEEAKRAIRDINEIL